MDETETMMITPMNPEDEADLRATMTAQFGSDSSFIEAQIRKARYEVRTRKDSLTRWRALIAQEITRGGFRSGDRIWTWEALFDAFEAACEKSRINNEVDTHENAMWPLARKWVAEVSDYRIWKIQREVETAGSLELTCRLISLAGTDDPDELQAPGQACRKRFEGIVEEITDGRRS